MTLDSLSVLLEGQENLGAIDGWVAAANAMGQTVEEFLFSFVKEQGREFAARYQIGVMASSEFLLRFPANEIAGVVQAAAINTDIAGLLAEVRREPLVFADDPRLVKLNDLVAAGLLAPERPAQVLAYERPEPRDFEAEQAVQETPIGSDAAPGQRASQEGEP